jgi:hypothetical protein
MAPAMQQDFFTSLVDLVDRSFMLLYTHTRRNARRITHLAVALVPLMALLVGSCKTPGAGNAFAKAGPEQFRAALFPDRAYTDRDGYQPAAGYIAQARNFVEAAPETMKMLTRQEVGYIYGRPALHRRDADAEIWQYNTRRCVVDFYFYGDHQLAYIDARLKKEMARGGTKPLPAKAQSKCLGAVDAVNIEGI